jgi:hypothetical protein
MITAMVSTRKRCSASATVLGCAVVMTAALVSGCSRVVDGFVRSAPASTVVAATAPVPVADLLIEPAHFPAEYPAVVLAPTAVDPVLRDVDGVTAGGVVTPPSCAPPVPEQAPLYTAVVEGTDPKTAGSLIVSVTRSSFPLSTRKDQLTACPSFTAVVGGAASTVTVTLLAPPPVDADDSYAVDKTVVSDGAESTTRTLTLVAQIADVRVSATWLSKQDSSPDSEAVDTVFTDAVLKVRRGVRP